MAQYNLGRVQGLSAYEVAVQQGYEGTETEWLTWLKAKNGTEVEINGELQPNVNFIRNEIVKDGLISYEKDLKLANISKIVSFSANTEIEVYMKVWFEQSNNTRLIDFGSFSIVVDSTAIGIFDGSSTSKTIPHTYPISFVFRKTGTNAELILDDGTTVKRILRDNYSVSSITYNTGVKKENIVIYYSNVYNRHLTAQEIQHNFSVLNNSPSINHINDYAISTDTDHIQDRTGRVQESINRVFYKNMCKEFTSSGEPITVNNGMDGYVLSGKIEGQTVKRINILAEWVDTTTIFNSYTKLSHDSNYTIYNFSDKKVKVYSKRWVDDTDITNFYLEPNMGYPLKDGWVTQVRGINSDGWNVTTDKEYFKNNICIVSGIINKAVPFGLNSTQAVVSNLGVKYSFYKDATDKASGTVITLGGVGGVYDTLEIKEDGSGVYTQKFEPLKLLNASQIKLTNAPQPYFSINIINAKFSGKCISNKISDVWLSPTLNLIGFRVTGIDTIESLNTWIGENQPTIMYELTTPIVTTIDKSLMPAILTQATNTFQFGDAVAPYKVTIQAPVNRIADFETRIAQLEKVIASTSNLSLLGNYAEDEYNNLINQL